jgi:glycosyltransferase involved in cell wall biosynthesis
MKISLVIPVRNEVRSLPSLIESIRRQTRSPEEILLVDGGSTDATVALARELTANDRRFRVLEAGEATPGRGRNVGITATVHEWVALTDAGIRLDPAWLERLVEAAERAPSARVVYGNYEPVAGSFFERCAALAYVEPKRRRGGGWMRGPSIASALVHRDAWTAAGGFPDLRSTEDHIFMERLQELGFEATWAPEATVMWQLQPSLVRTYRRFALYSKCNVWAGRQRYWHYGLARQYLLATPFLGLSVVHLPAWLAVPACGFAARVAKSLWQRREGRGLLWLLNPLQIALVGVILVTIDLAMFAGWVRARLSAPPPARSPAAGPEPSGAELTARASQ